MAAALPGCQHYVVSLEKDLLKADKEQDISNEALSKERIRTDSLVSELNGRQAIISNRDSEVGILKKKVTGLKLLLGGSLVLTIVVIVIAL